MRILHSVDMTKIVSKDETRPTINNPHTVKYEGKDYLCATNGKSLLMVPVELETTDTPGYVPASMVKRTENYLSLNGDSVTNTTGTSMKRPEGEFPDVLNVLPKADRKTENLSFDVKLLSELVASFKQKDTKVTLEYARDSNGKVTTPITILNNNSVIAIFMPTMGD